ncbi:MAG: FCD domain-containing protein [Blastopirellula sp. JB062]
MARRAARRQLEEDHLRAILAGNQPVKNGAARLDNRLHAYWIELSQNFYIRDFFARHGVFHAAIFDFATVETAEVEAMAAQHCEILEALLAQNWKNAEKVLREHIRSQIPRVEKMLDQLRAAPD